MKSGRSSRAGLAKGNSRGRAKRSSSNTRHGRKSFKHPGRCVLYVVEGDRFEVLVLEVNPHDY